MIPNQKVINAIYAAAEELGSSGWALLEKANLTHLVRDRQALYTGPAIDTIDTLSDGGKTLIKAALPPLPPPVPRSAPRKPLEGKGFYIC